MGFKTRTNQPINPEVMDYNEETNTVEIGTNLYVDGTIKTGADSDLYCYWIKDLNISVEFDDGSTDNIMTTAFVLYSDELITDYEQFYTDLYKVLTNTNIIGFFESNNKVCFYNIRNNNDINIYGSNIPQNRGYEINSYTIYNFTTNEWVEY